MQKQKPNHYLLGGWLLCLLLSGCQPPPPSPTIDFDTATSTPSLFAEALVSTDLNERDLAISPHGDELFFTVNNLDNSVRAIARIVKEDGQWSLPKIASFSGDFKDIEPYFSPDGKRLYYASTRPLSGDETKTDYDLWFVEREGDSWGDPQHIPAPVNTDGNEFYPAVANSGNLYFTTTDSLRNENIFLSEWRDGQYSQPVALDSAINTPTYEFNAYVSPDENVILFSSYGREDGFGGGDLYYSIKGENGQWQAAVNLGETINSPFLDYCPFVDWNHNTLYFSSNRPGAARDTSWTYQAIGASSRSTLNGLGNIYHVQLPSDIPSANTN